MGGRGRRSIVSALFLVAAIGLLGAAALLWLQDRRAEDAIEIPIAGPGKNELIHVTSALSAEGIEVVTLSGASAVRSGMLEVPGQPLTADGQPLYVFIYQPDAAAREQATLDVAADQVDLSDNAGEPVATTGLRLITGSNVALVLVGGTDELAAEITAALERLP